MLYFYHFLLSITIVAIMTIYLRGIRIMIFRFFITIITIVLIILVTGRIISMMIMTIVKRNLIN